MDAQSIKTPGPDHPIEIHEHPGRVVVKVADKIVADSQKALALHEASYPAVLYFPREDVDMSLLQRTDHSSHCPYKGDANYYSIPTGGTRSVNAVWSYEAPFAAVAQIKGYLAFYPDRVDAITEHPITQKK